MIEIPQQPQAPQPGKPLAQTNRRRLIQLIQNYAQANHDLAWLLNRMDAAHKASLKLALDHAEEIKGSMLLLPCQRRTLDVLAKIVNTLQGKEPHDQPPQSPSPGQANNG